MSKVVIIEVRGETAGIAVGSTGHFRFFSSQVPFDTLDGKIFRSVEQVSRMAAARLASQTLRKAA